MICLSCYHPMFGIPVGINVETGKTRFAIKKASSFTDFDLVKKDNPDGIIIPCGRCSGCRLDYSRAWADRMLLELDHTRKAVFLTLTYDNAHLPISMYTENDNPMFGTLDKRDVQLFMKRLRKYFEPKEIRFYAAGEYGPKTLRPHYHIILFGLDLGDFPDRKLKDGVSKNELGQLYYVSDTLSKIWSNGFILLCDVSWSAMAYVSRYVQKKLYGPLSIAYAERNVVPEFSLMSRRPGLGGYYLVEHPDVFENSNISLSTTDGAKQIQIPKYFYKQLELTDPERYGKIMEDKKKFADSRMLLKLQKTGLSYLDYLEVEENKLLDRTKALKRCAI